MLYFVGTFSVLLDLKAHTSLPSLFDALFCQCNGRKLLNSSPPPLETGVMWSISHPYLEFLSPYFEKFIYALHWSFRQTLGSLFETVVALFQTASFVLSSNAIIPPW